MNLKLIHYINISLVSHLLFITFLSFASPYNNDTGPRIFDVNIVPPSEIQEPPKPETAPPPLREKKPSLLRRRSRPPARDVKPEDLYSEGTGRAEKESGKPGLSTPSEEKDKKESPSSSKEEDRAKPEENGLALAPYSYLFDRQTIEKYARKSTPSKKGLSFDTSGFKHRGYMRMLRESIEDIWKYPKEAARRGLSGDLYIKFTIKKDGKLKEVELVRTSGRRELDEAAMEAIRKAAPFWPLPEDWDRDTLEITGHFIYIFGNTFAL